MLVLSRKVGERIVIEPGIEIAVVAVCGSRVRLGIDAPPEISIRRMEIEPFVEEFLPAVHVEAIGDAC